MSNQFFVLLPSNTPGYEDNKPNKFRVHLPRKLRFDGTWSCGLHSIVYPNTWPAIGTTELQYMVISLETGINISIPIPKGSYLTPKELETTLYKGIVHEVENNLSPGQIDAGDVIIPGHRRGKRTTNEVVQLLSRNEYLEKIKLNSDKIKNETKQLNILLEKIQMLHEDSNEKRKEELKRDKIQQSITDNVYELKILDYLLKVTTNIGFLNGINATNLNSDQLDHLINAIILHINQEKTFLGEQAILLRGITDKSQINNELEKREYSLIMLNKFSEKLSELKGGKTALLGIKVIEPISEYLLQTYDFDRIINHNVELLENDQKVKEKEFDQLKTLNLNESKDILESNEIFNRRNEINKYLHIITENMRLLRDQRNIRQRFDIQNPSRAEEQIVEMNEILNYNLPRTISQEDEILLNQAKRAIDRVLANIENFKINEKFKELISPETKILDSVKHYIEIIVLRKDVNEARRLAKLSKDMFELAEKKIKDSGKPSSSNEISQTDETSISSTEQRDLVTNGSTILEVPSLIEQQPLVVDEHDSSKNDEWTIGLSERRDQISPLIKKTPIKNYLEERFGIIENEDLDTANLDEMPRAEALVGGLLVHTNGTYTPREYLIINGKLKRKEYEKGSIFQNELDLRNKWLQNEKKDWNSLKELLIQMGNRNPRIYVNRSEEIRRRELNENRRSIISEISEEGSEFYKEMSHIIDHDREFIRKLSHEKFTNSTRYQDLEKLDMFERDSRIILETIRAVKFEYIDEIHRFRLNISNEGVKEVHLSDQICYVLGFDVGKPIRKGDTAKYAYDLRGGVSHICVYINGLTDQMIVGDRLASLLQIVAVSGNPGDIIEKQYNSPIFNKVMGKEIDDIEIELRTLEGRLIPFDYGVVIVTLIFKKMIIF